MKEATIAFVHAGLTIQAGRCGAGWCGQIVDELGEVLDVFAYTRDGYPGAVIGALSFPEVSFATALAARLWLHTTEEPAEAGGALEGAELLAG
jgi:hypothetical protein